MFWSSNLLQHLTATLFNKITNIIDFLATPRTSFALHTNTSYQLDSYIQFPAICHHDRFITGWKMLACVCQPSDTGIFRRSPVPLGAPPLKINRGAIPKPGRTLRLSSPVITSEPSAKNKQTASTSGNEGKTRPSSPKGCKVAIKEKKGAEKCDVGMEKCSNKEVGRKSAVIHKV